jgi:DNA-binding NarL/FixJ family response regulator
VIPPLEELTKREMDILGGVAAGLTSKQIGKKLYISENTVKFHLTNLLRKGNWTNRAAAAAWFGYQCAGRSNRIVGHVHGGR